MENAPVLPQPQRINQPQDALGFAVAVTTSAAKILTTGVKCIGVEIQSSTKDDANGSVTGITYIKAGGVNIYELLSGKSVFIPCSHTDQITVLTQTGTAFVRGIVHQQPTLSSAMTLPPYLLVFDVESVGLLGEPFAVGGVVVASDGTPLRPKVPYHDQFIYACPHSVAAGSLNDRHWVEQNVKIDADDIKAGRPAEVYAQFWMKWLHWKQQGAWLVADVAFPVEARFLLNCAVTQDGKNDLPYPLLDVSSILLAAGRDPLASYPRIKGETPKHNPLADAKQSARLLLEALSVLNGNV